MRPAAWNQASTNASTAPPGASTCADFLHTRERRDHLAVFLAVMCGVRRAA